MPYRYKRCCLRSPFEAPLDLAAERPVPVRQSRDLVAVRPSMVSYEVRGYGFGTQSPPRPKAWRWWERGYVSYRRTSGERQVDRSRVVRAGLLG